MSTGAINWDTPMEKVAVFRALNLGDMLCAIPAIRGLRRRLPGAHISLIGLPAGLPVMQRFPGFFDEFIAFPGDPAFPEQPVRESDLPGFYAAMRRRRFDLVLQMHGSGRRANTLVRTLAPLQWGGFVPEPRQAEPGRLMPWPDHLHEVHRYLALLRYIGVEVGDDRLEFPISAVDRHEADSLAARRGLQPEKTVFIHPGARLASRRWPIERFARVARRLAEDGWQIAVTGSQAETDMAHTLRARSGHALHDLCGATTLGALASLLQRGKLLICNDTGVSHLAASVRLPSVVIASGSDVARWAPLDAARHTVLHKPMACRPCAYNACPIGHPCALGVGVERVLNEARRHLQGDARQ